MTVYVFAVYVIMDYASGGDLYKLLDSQPNRRFSNEQSAVYIRQLVGALLFLHDQVWEEHVHIKTHDYVSAFYLAMYVSLGIRAQKFIFL